MSSRFRTPYVAILFTGACIAIALFFDLHILVKMASTVLVSTFLFSCLAVIVMRESRIQNYEPKFRSPLYPWIQIVGIIGCGLLIFEMGREILIALSVFVVGSLFVYWFYGRIRTSREYALLHLIERITAKEITSHSLETELKEIIQERDEITKDRFDSIVENCIVLDIDTVMTLDDLFSMIAEVLSGRVAIDKSVLSNLLLTREKETSTVIGHGIAIPHIIIEGEKIFDILLVRCKQGVQFSESTQKV